MNIVDIENTSDSEFYVGNWNLSREYNLDYISKKQILIEEFVKTIFIHDNIFFKSENIKNFSIEKFDESIIFSFAVKNFSVLYFQYWRLSLPDNIPKDIDVVDEEITKYLIEKNVVEAISMRFGAYETAEHRNFQLAGGDLDKHIRYAPTYETVVRLRNENDFVLFSDEDGRPELVSPGFLSNTLAQQFRSKLLVKDKPYSAKEKHSELAKILVSETGAVGDAVCVDDLGPFEEFVLECPEDAECFKASLPEFSNKEEIAIADYIFEGRGYDVVEADKSVTYKAREPHS